MNPRIAVVADVASRVALEEILSSCSLSPMVIAGDWPGLDKIPDLEPDLVIVDERSGSDGLGTVLHQLRLSYRGPLIVLGSERRQTVEYLEAGADYYLCHTLSSKYLLTHVMRLLRPGHDEGSIG